MLDLKKYSDEQISKIIDNRIQELENTAQKTEEIGNVERYSAKASHHKGFISRNTKVCYSLSQGYYIKNNDYIREFIGFIKQNNLSPSPKTVFKFLKHYFGEFPDINTRNENDFREISDFKQSGRAMCTERAALANNILSFLGLETWFCDGCVLSKNVSGDHAFLIVKGESGKYMLYDPSYTIYYRNEEHPFFREIKGDIAKNLVNAEIYPPSKDNYIKIHDYYPKTIDGKTKIENLNSFRIYGVGVNKDELLKVLNERNENER